MSDTGERRSSKLAKPPVKLACLAWYVVLFFRVCCGLRCVCIYEQSREDPRKHQHVRL